MVLAQASPRYVTFVVVDDDEGAGDDDGIKGKYSLLSQNMEYISSFRHLSSVRYLFHEEMLKIVL